MEQFRNRLSTGILAMCRSRRRLRRSALAIETEQLMPIHRSFTVSLTLAGAVACGAAYLPALAADVGGSPGAKAGWQTVRDEGARDLRPTAKPNPSQGQRPHVTLRPSTPVVPIGA